jgi:hypothetical protein
LRLEFLLAVMTMIASAAIVERAAACARCQSFGATAQHVHAIGSADAYDARSTPVAASGDPETVTPQFVLQGGKWPQPDGLGTPITLTYSYENMFDGALKMPNGQPLPALLIRRSIERALELWAEIVPIHFVEVPDDGKEYFQGASQYGQLRFRHVYINGPDLPNQPPMAKAQAYFPFSGDPYAGDVEFDHSDPWQEVGTLPAPDILGAMTHELGHSLGLGHTDNSQANMFWIFRRTKGLHDGWLHSDDIAGMHQVYGEGQGSVTPLVIPEPGAIAMTLIAFAAWLAASRARSPADCT